MNGSPFGLLGDLTRIQSARTRRSSSYDRTGGNHDAWTILPGETRPLLDVDGPGCVRHVWMTLNMRRLRWHDYEDRDPDFYRKAVLAMYWDDEPYPSVLAPLGDFFCLGHSLSANFCSLPFSSSTQRPGQFGAGCALNCYLPMPFGRSARIEVTNEGDWPLTLYFYIDYETLDQPLPPDSAYLHAAWRRESPTDGWGHDVRINSKLADAANTTGEGNYVILDARGQGHYIGMNLSVVNLAGGWWGEGDDMIFIDGRKWPPTLHGTGSEDCFNQAWGMQDNAFLFNGCSLHESVRPPYSTQYVFHLTNPVRFRESVRVTMEHGHANHLANDWASTAYWYQLEPHRRVTLGKLKHRLPLRSPLGSESIRPDSIPDGPATEEMTGNRRQAKADFRRRLNDYLQQCAARARREQDWVREDRRDNRRAKEEK
ncbi:MAG: hypothetical protein BIFFINMI_01655 [Phycisphaerae bacterium]|nr:hypothetical protein [Phycisphaerae bacterium]